MKINSLASFMKCYAYIICVVSLVGCGGGGGGGGIDIDIGGGIEGICSYGGLECTPPEFREDGTGLDNSEISSFHIYYGTEQGDYQNQIDIFNDPEIEVVLPTITPGDYFVVMTAVDIEGRESLYSDEIMVNW